MGTVVDYFTEVIPRVYMPVMRELLTKEELATLELSIRSAPDGAALSGDFPASRRMTAALPDTAD